MTIYLIYNLYENRYLCINEDVDETVTACFSSYDKAATFIKTYMHKYYFLKNEDNRFEYYDSNKYQKIDLYIEEVSVH